MRKLLFCVFLVLLCENLVAADYFVGMRNQRDAFVGMSYGNFGFAIDHSVLPQSVQKQYVRVAPFYKFNAGSCISGYYLFFAGWRYDGQYNDYGVLAHLELKVLKDWIYILGSYQPFYDSFFDQKNGYGAWVKFLASPEVAFVGGIKNLPEYREVERRYSVALQFSSSHLNVMPELSVPMTNNLHKMRVSLAFIYENLF